jgi:hypothetical protein
VYDYALVTEPLSDAQLASLGWKDRRGASDLGNQFHYFRLTRDNRILWGGYDAVYFNGGRIHDEQVPFPPEPLRSAVVQLTRSSLARADRNDGRRDPWLRLLDRLGLGYDS